ncbi:MAG: group 1 truncated hemoglobin [Verrucomicrobia bacterium]|nr:group 1 truncated hemoglobin [Verrucomicrobiota bacterium]
MPLQWSVLVSSALTAAILASASPAQAQPASQPASSQINTVCPISGKPANPKITAVYEERTYAFADETCRTQFKEARQNSLYHKLGGKAAIDAAVESFYVKVLADARIKHFFEDVNMNRQRRKQKEFLSAAFGGPIPWTGKDLRKAHANLPGLNDTHFNAVAEHLQKTLEELKVPKELIDQVMAIAASTRKDVLNR